MRAGSGMILLFAVALPLLRGAAWGETPVTEKPAPSADKPKASACDHHAFRAVIDVGHTHALGGATSARGIYEYEFNLRPRWLRGYRPAKKSVCTNWTSGMLTLPTIANIANSTAQSNPMLIPSDGSSFACRSERRSPDMATLLVIEDAPTLVQPTKDECDGGHN
jgi:hypothetical protein